MKLLASLFVVIVFAVGCEHKITPEKFVVKKLQESLHDPKSLEVISITSSPLDSTYWFLWNTKMKSKELANGDPFTNLGRLTLLGL